MQLAGMDLRSRRNDLQGMNASSGCPNGTYRADNKELLAKSYISRALLTHVLGSM